MTPPGLQCNDIDSSFPPIILVTQDLLCLTTSPPDYDPSVSFHNLQVSQSLVAVHHQLLPDEKGSAYASDSHWSWSSATHWLTISA